MRGRGVTAYGLIGAVAVYAAVATGKPVLGQTTTVAAVPRSAIVTVDQEQLFSESAYGLAVLSLLEEASQALAAENRNIEATLSTEERALTEQRPTMTPDEFRARAAVFDARVVALRQTQDEKTRLLARQRDAMQKVFFREVAPILADLVRERGALALLDSRAVILSAEQIDITDEAIAAANTILTVPETLTDASVGADPAQGDPK